VAWSALYFFCLLGGYYVIRPVRDTMGIAGGVDQLQWLFTGTLLATLLAVPLYGWLAGRFPRAVLLPVVYGFFIVNLLGFYAVFVTGVAPVIAARTFFIWTSVFNLFAVSVFWSFMADLYRSEQARRLFALIAVGGSAGAIAGPSATALLAARIGTEQLLPVAAAVLALALVCIARLRAWGGGAGAPGVAGTDTDVGLGGRMTDGFRRLAGSRYLAGIGGFIVLYTLVSTFLYFEQARIVKAAFSDEGARTAAFATIDLAVNTLTVLLQAFVTHRLVLVAGVPLVLALLPVLVAAGFLLLGLMPVFGVLMVVQIARRAGNYAITRPAREMLFTVLPREDKYKTKNVLDTLVYRGGDAASAWLFSLLAALGFGVSGTMLFGAAAATVWAALGIWLGRRYGDLGGRLEDTLRGTVTPAGGGR